jgi:hypothetical protein
MMTSALVPVTILDDPVFIKLKISQNSGHANLQKGVNQELGCLVMSAKFKWHEEA